MEDIKIYPLENSERLNEVCELFALGLANTTKEWWIWKHFTPNGLPEGVVLVAEDSKNYICGVFAMQPAYYCKADEKIMLVQLEDLVIAPEYRGNGLMRRLYDFTLDYYREKNAAGLIGLSANEKSYAVLSKYGFENIADLNGIQSVKTLTPRFWRKDFYKKDEWEITISQDIPQGLFFAQKQNVWKMEKNQQFMEWKFKNSPEREYCWLVIKYRNELVGYIVYYVNQGRLRKVVNICDWELKASVTEKELKKAVRILQTQGNWIYLWGCMSREDEELWKKSGISLKKENKSPFLYYSLNERNKIEAFDITKADSDN